MDCEVRVVSRFQDAMIVVFLSDIDWHGLHQRPQHIALALAKQWTILWVQPATLGSQSNFTAVAVEPNIYVISVPAVPYNAKSKIIRTIAKLLSYFPPFRAILNYFQIRIIRKAVHTLQANTDTVGVVVHNFQLINILVAFRTSFVLFDYLDNVFGFTRLPNHVKEYWKKAIRQADIITVTSSTLKTQIEQYRTDNIHLVGNGVEYELFSEKPATGRPADLPEGKPIIGYVGAVYPWLDYELIEYAATEMPEAQFVFIGPSHPDVAGVIQKLAKKQNIRFLGLKKYQQIPSYLQWFDAGIIPFQRNDLTVAVNPVKLYEYSAAGVPAVVTDFSDDLHQFSDRIFIVQSKTDFVAALRKAIQKRNDVSSISVLKAFAREHDWRSKTSTLTQLIQNKLSSGKKQLKEL